MVEYYSQAALNGAFLGVGNGHEGKNGRHLTGIVLTAWGKCPQSSSVPKGISPNSAISPVEVTLLLISSIG
jgi:hypothetical protein